MGPVLCSVTLDMVCVTLHRGFNATTGKRTVGHLASPKELKISWLRCRESLVSSDGSREVDGGPFTLQIRYCVLSTSGKHTEK